MFVSAIYGGEDHRAQVDLHKKLFAEYHPYYMPHANASQPVVLEFEVAIRQIYNLVSFPPSNLANVRD